MSEQLRINLIRQFHQFRQINRKQLTKLHQ